MEPLRSETRDGMRIDWDVPITMDDGADLVTGILRDRLFLFGAYVAYAVFEPLYDKGAAYAWPLALLIGAEPREIVFTSIMKNMNVAVFNVIKAALEGNFKGGVFIGIYAAYVAYLILAAQQHDALGTFSAVMLGFVVPITLITLVVVMLRGPKGTGDGH